MVKILGPGGIEYLEKRGISAKTASRYGVYTVKNMPGFDGGVLCFPFLEHGVVVNEKFRGIAEKDFRQMIGGRKTFWNADVLDDPAVSRDGLPPPVIITEGEIDALTAIECGFHLAMSVPDGAPPARHGEHAAKLEKVDHTGDQIGKFQFMWNNRERLKRTKRFVIAVDNDEPGQRLAEELVRRLTAAKCMFVEYPDDCKDLNDVLTKHGANAVRQVISRAKPYPVHGLYELSDYPELGELRKFSTGWPGMDDFLKLWLGELMVVTGVPNHGKSAWVLHLLYHLAKYHGWGSVIFSPEMPVVPHLRDRMRRIHIEKHVHEMTQAERSDADHFIKNFFYFIDADPKTGISEEELTLDWIIEKAEDAVLRYGVSVLVIDPWNEVEHARGRNEMVTDYVGRSLRQLKAFARRCNVVVIVIAHPTKEVFSQGTIRKVSLYDIEGSAHWYNKCDHGLVVRHPKYDKNRTEIDICKVRFPGTGKKGEVPMDYWAHSCRYTDGSAEEEPAHGEAQLAPPRTQRPVLTSIDGGILPDSA